MLELRGGLSRVRKSGGISIQEAFHDGQGWGVGRGPGPLAEEPHYLEVSAGGAACKETSEVGRTVGKTVSGVFTVRRLRDQAEPGGGGRLPGGSFWKMRDAKAGACADESDPPGPSQAFSLLGSCSWTSPCPLGPPQLGMMVTCCCSSGRRVVRRSLMPTACRAVCRQARPKVQDGEQETLTWNPPACMDGRGGSG